MLPYREWGEAGIEPDLATVLADPLMHLVMRRDGVTRAQLDAVITEARAKLQPCLCRCAA